MLISERVPRNMANRGMITLSVVVARAMIGESVGMIFCVSFAAILRRAVSIHRP